MGSYVCVCNVCANIGLQKKYNEKDEIGNHHKHTTRCEPHYSCFLLFTRTMEPPNDVYTLLRALAAKLEGLMPYQEHLEQVAAARKKYYKHNEKARQDPDKYERSVYDPPLVAHVAPIGDAEYHKHKKARHDPDKYDSMIFDGMTQATTELPR